MPRHVVLKGDRIVGIFTSSQLYVAIENEDPDNPVTAETHYYPDPGVITPRPAQTNAWNKTTVQADGEDLMIMTGLAADAKIVLRKADLSEDPVDIPVIGGEAKIGFMSAGTYTVRVVEWPKRELVDTVVVEEVIE